LREKQAKKAEADLKAARAAIEVLEPLHIDISPFGLASTRKVFNVGRITFGYDASAPVRTNVSFAVQGSERLAIEGANSSGNTQMNV
jgi:ATPase subunit of ABC transporter with duplicated ATPase domains